MRLASRRRHLPTTATTTTNYRRLLSSTHSDPLPPLSPRYVAFNVVNCDGGTYFFASYLVVMDLRATEVHVEVVEETTSDYGALHFDGLKMRDPYHLLLAGNNDPLMEEGPAYVYNWRDGNLSVLAAGEMQAQGAHDIQWQPADLAKGEKAGLWRPNTHGFYLVDAVTGDVRETYVAPPNIFDDINHAQVLHDGPYAIVNSRLRDSFTKYDMTTGVAEWTVGGHAGTLDIVDLDGARVPKGHSVFFGQHNTEYFGDGEYMMFDNNFNSSTNAFVGDGKSRLLIVSVDETEKLATLVWELELEDQTCIYGDNDRLPTGNLLASAWPSVISADASFQYDAREYYYEHEYEYYLYKYYYY